MSFASQDIHNAAGPGSSAEPSMEEILASIRRILKEDEPGKPAEPAIAMADPIPADADDDVLVLDESMIARPADYSSATTPPVEERPAGEHPGTPLTPPGEALHFSSEPVPFAREYEPFPRAVPEPVVELPEVIDAEPQALPGIEHHENPAPHQVPSAAEPEITEPAWPAWLTRQAEPEPGWAEPGLERGPEYDPEPSQESGRLWDALPPEPQAAPQPSLPEPDPYRMHGADAEPAAKRAADAAAHDEPEQSQEPDMNDSADNAFQPPDSLISDKATDAAASSIGALVRSMTTEKSVAISKGSSITIEDIVRDEIRPLLKSWLDTHLPSLVERIVRTEIERVISRSVV